MKNKINRWIEKAFFSLVLAILSFTATTIKDMAREIFRLSESMSKIASIIQQHDVQIERIARFEERIIRLEERAKITRVRMERVEDKIGIKGVLAPEE